MKKKIVFPHDQDVVNVAFTLIILFYTLLLISLLPLKLNCTPNFVCNSRYMALEYAMEGLFFLKSDTYNFGVLLLEILSGKKKARLYIERIIPKTSISCKLLFLHLCCDLTLFFSHL